jgi:S1-C subfamily serine protease
MTLNELATGIREATKDFAKERARAGVSDLLAGLASPAASLSDKEADQLVQALNECRWFDLTEEVGRALVARGVGSRATHRRIAQALIERGAVADARSVLLRLDATPKLPLSERAEIRGLLGRARKQEAVTRYKLSSVWPEDALAEAVMVYLDVYESDPPTNSWHGINAVALLSLANRHGLQNARVVDPLPIAQQIVDQFEDTRPSDRKTWDFAMVAEANMALGKWDDATVYLRRYVQDEGVNAFALGSTLRQFEEIWQLDQPGHPGRPLLTLVRASLVEKEKGSIVLKPEHVQTALGATAKLEYEKVFGKDGFVTLENYLRGVECCRSVARIGTELSRGEGTGFIMRGADFSSKLGAEPVLVTNAHVLDPAGTSGGIDPDDALVSFHAHETIPPTQAFKIKRVLWSSRREELDVTVATLDAAVPLAASYRVAKQLPNRGARVVVIGHPGGGALSFSLADNELLDFEDGDLQIGRLHYRTPTEGGSSGSPVFSMDWRLIGLHHAGGDSMQRLNEQSGTYQANEGIRIDRIRSAFDAKYVHP